MLLVSVVDAIACQGPGLDVAEDVWVIAERAQTGRTTNDLLLIDSTQHGEARLGRKGQAEAGAADHALAHERPHQVLVIAVCAHLGRKTKDAVLIVVHAVL